MSKNGIISFILISLVIINFAFTFNSFSLDKKNHILIINSYSPAFSYTRSVVKGISSILSPNSTIHVENIDVQINNSEEYFNYLSDSYKHKFKNYKFDIIIATDNSAYNFLNTYHDQLFKNIPVVFCGFDKFSSNDMVKNDNFFYIENNLNPIKTLDISLKLHPDYKTVFIPFNPYFLNNYYKNLIKDGRIYLKSKNIKVIIYYSNKIDDVLSKIKELPDKSIIITTTPFISNNDLISTQKSSELISKSSSMPIYCFFDDLLNSGATGGMVCVGYSQGELAGKIAFDIINGKKIENHNFLVPTKYMFDYSKLKQFNTDFSKLPKNSILINKPSTVYTIPKGFMHIVSTFIIIILLININKRKKIEKYLKKNKKLYKNLIEFLPYGIILCSDKKIQFVNQTMLKLMSSNDCNDFIGKNPFDFIHPDYHSIVNNKIKEQEKGKIPEVVEQVAIKFDGTYLDIEAYIYPFIFDEFKSLIIVRDITEKKQTEKLQKQIKQEKEKLKQALEYDKFKTEFFANLSHELKTPLNLIFGTTQLIESNIRNYSLDNRMYKHINILKQNSYRLLRLVNNIIDITKMDCGYFDLNLKNQNIVNIVEDITLSVAEYVQTKHISLLFDTDVEEKIMAVDPDSIERIILNLLSNSIKFTNKGDSIQVNIYDKNDHIVISVKDTGIGIPKDKLDIIFDRFRQVDKSLTRNNEGSGIGLSVVKSLIDMYNGQIDVISEYGRGSEFIVKLPVKVLANSNIVNDDIYISQNKYIEKINIEFSDIYSLY